MISEVVSLSREALPSVPVEGTHYFIQYRSIKNKDIGYFASRLPAIVKSAGIVCNDLVWDFVTIALSVSAADNTVLRCMSEDGWTRHIKLSVAVCNPSRMQVVRKKLESMLKFLTGDLWSLEFLNGGVPPPKVKRTGVYSEDCVTLLSGGMDSLVGAIDLAADGLKPLIVSHVVRGNAPQQERFAHRIFGTDCSFFQLNQALQNAGEEGSTRGRSIVFFAFAALVAQAIKKDRERVKIFVAENGFISLNLPLSPGRAGSLSTKTTHPYYMRCLQEVWDDLGFELDLVTNYKFKTKGDMLRECKNKDLLRELVYDSTSCGKFLRHKSRHCGRCVPCMVRRAAFLSAGMPDTTLYEYMSLKNAFKGKHPNDSGAMAYACRRLHDPDYMRTIYGSFSFAEDVERELFVDTYKKGLGEIENFLRNSSQSVL